jgi:hypothetical protein
MKITFDYLKSHPNHNFVFGDNLIHRGYKGAAIFRDFPNALGFSTKKYPDYEADSYYRPSEYKPFFSRMLKKFEERIKSTPEKTYLITALGSGLANRYHIWEEVVQPGLEILRKYPNVIFLWEVKE